MLTQEQLKKLLTYCPDTGVFTWNAGGRKHKHGAVAGYKHEGYILISINYQTYRAHRLAWLYVHGYWPKHVIDHKNGVRDANWIDNLRDVTQAINSQGFRSISKNNKSGYTGVNWSSRLKGFTAARMINGKSKFLGIFNTAEEAADAYANAHNRPAADPRRYRARRETAQMNYMPATKSLTTGNFHATLRAMATHTRNARIRVQEFLPQLRTREMTNREVAGILGVTEEHLSRTLTEIGFEKEPAIDRAAQKAATADKKARIAAAARDFPPEEAARIAGVSVRTIYRYLDKQK